MYKRQSVYPLCFYLLYYLLKYSHFPNPKQSLCKFNPTFKALYFYFTDIVSNHTVADIDTPDMTVGLEA